MSFLSGKALPLLTLLGGVMKSTAQIQQGRREAQIHEYNAAVYRQQAFLIGEKAKLDVERQRTQARKFKSAQVATVGASGVRLTGSPLEVIEDTAAEFILDQNITDFNARVDQWAALTNANLSLKKAQIARSSSFIKAGSSLLDMLPTLALFGKSDGIKTAIDTAAKDSATRNLGGSEIRFLG
jgi:hypothetical protein